MEARPAMRAALAPLRRFIGTPLVGKHRVFIWMEHPTVPDSRIVVFAREDDYSFGVLHSRVHEVWSLARTARHGVGNDPTYNNNTCFEAFPFPWPPGLEPSEDSRVGAIAVAAQQLIEQRDRWLNPPGATDTELKSRTLTDLYSERPAWLANAHAKLDAVVYAAYGWPADLTNEEILSRLLELNLSRGAA